MSLTTMPSATAVQADARLSAPPADALIAIYEAPHLEREKKQFREYLLVDRAHAVMLAEQGILSPTAAAAILSSLIDIEEKGPAALSFAVARGGFVFQIEHFLAERIGEDFAGRLHIGRSRLDQGPTVRRLYKRRRLLEIFDRALALSDTLQALAARHLATVMPGYTCLQHAHPTVFGHYLLSFVSKLHDDIERLEDSYRRLDRCPLGAAGLSGTSWPIDRQRVADLLGFGEILENAKLAREAYYAADVIGGLSFLMATLNDLATDLHIWSSMEFGFVECADEFCGTSSIFPQKKNPTALEAVKFAAGGSVTWLATALATFRAEGTGDVVMREVPQIDAAFDATEGSLQLMAAVVSSLTVHATRMEAVASNSWATATGLADEIVARSSYSFRQAHHIVARLVRDALTANVSSASITSEMLDHACVAVHLTPVKLPTETIRGALEARRFVASRSSQGGTAALELGRLAARARSEALTLLHHQSLRRGVIQGAATMLGSAQSRWLSSNASQSTIS
jgi:argininosuccinate lyase